MVHPLTREAWKLHDKNNRCAIRANSQRGLSKWPAENPALHFLVSYFEIVILNTRMHSCRDFCIYKNASCENNSVFFFL